MGQPLVLLVDDNEFVGQAMVDVLTTLGLSVDWARTGEEGFSLFCNRRPDAVVTDNVMPNLSGLDLARRIKAACPRARVVMLSAVPPPEAHSVCDVVLGKPVRLGVLTEVLQSLGVLPTPS